MNSSNMILNRNFFPLVTKQNTRYILIKDQNKYLRLPKYVVIRLSDKEHYEIIFSKESFEEKQFMEKLCLLLNYNQKTYNKTLTLRGLGYKMSLSPNKKFITFKLGYSHEIGKEIPFGVKLLLNKSKVKVQGLNREIVGSFSKTIYDLKPHNVYKNKGYNFKYQNYTLKEIKK